jgi:competence protein ComEC
MYWGWITKAFFLALGIFFALILGVWVFIVNGTEAETKIVFLDVGQGDAVLITQGSNQIVIDGGRDGRQLLARLGRYMPFWDRTVETLIPTHPDADHIGGLAMLLERYQVETILDTGARTDTRTAFLFYRDMEHEGAARVSAIAGTEVRLPFGGTLQLLHPRTPLPADIPETNTGSIVARFDFGETSFLLTGDLPTEETYLPDIQPADILKVAHHGSRSSTSDVWLDLVRPGTAIISVGKNDYGHPHPEVLERLREHGVEVLRTDELGSIVFRCVQATEQCSWRP